MTMALYATIRLSEFASGSGFDLTLDETPHAGTTHSITNTELGNATSFLAHYDLSAGLSGARTLKTDLQTALNAATTVGHTYTVTFDETTGYYTITTSVGADLFDLTFNNAATRTLLGFSADQDSTYTYTSDQRCDYFIIPASPGISVVSDEYSPGGLSEEGELDDGTGVSVRVGTTPTYFDFTLQHEAHAATFTRKAAAAVPWTYQDLFEHCSSKFPFMIRDTNYGENIVLRLRSEGAQWDTRSRVRDVNDDDSNWTINFVGRLLGRAT